MPVIMYESRLKDAYEPTGETLCDELRQNCFETDTVQVYNDKHMMNGLTETSKVRIGKMTSLPMNNDALLTLGRSTRVILRKLHSEPEYAVLPYGAIWSKDDGIPLHYIVSMR